MKVLFIILWYKLLAFMKADLDFRSKNVIKNISAFIVYSAFAYGMYKVSYASLYNAITVNKIPVYLFHRFAEAILFLFFTMVNIGNIFVSLSTLYKSKEVDFLMTRPIGYKEVFVIKFFDNFLYSSGTLFLLLSVVLFAYTQYFGLNFWFFLYALIALFVPLSITAALLGVMLLFLIIKIASVIGPRITIALIILFYLTVLISFFIFANPINLVAKAEFTDASILNIFMQYDTVWRKLLPSSFVINGLYWSVYGSSWLSVGNAVLLIALSAVLFICCLIIAEKFYYKSYILIGGIRLRKEKPEGYGSNFLRLDSPFKGNTQYLSYLKKEIILFLRDPVQILHALLMAVLLLLFVVSIGGKPAKLFFSVNPQLQTVLYLVFFLFSSFLVNSLALRFIFPHQSLEGQAYWKLRSSPVDLAKITKLKYISYVVILLLIGESINLLTHRNFSSTLTLASAVITGFMTITIVSVNFGMGSYYVNYKEKNAIRIASSQGASTAFLICLLYLGVIIALLFLPVYQYFFLTQNQLQIIGFSHFVKPISIIALISVFLTIVFYLIAKREVSRDI